MQKLDNGNTIPTTGAFKLKTLYTIGGRDRAVLLSKAKKYYDVPGRSYHDWQHIRSMLSMHRTVFQHDPTDALFLAIVMHDAIYVPGRSPESETMSIGLVPQFFRAALERAIAPTLLRRVSDLISWTLPATHSRDNRSHFDVNSEAARMLDLDLNAMSSDWREFVDTQMRIDEEFAHMGTKSQRINSAAAFLSTFAARGFVYYTPEMASLLNKSAVRNLRAVVWAVQKQNVLDYRKLNAFDPSELEAKFVAHQNVAA